MTGVIRSSQEGGQSGEMDGGAAAVIEEPAQAIYVAKRKMSHR